MVNALIRWGIVVIMGIITFLPQYGIIALTLQWFLTFPVLISIGLMLWTIALSLVLPLSLKVFRWVSGGAVTLISTSLCYLLWTYLPFIFAAWPIFMWAVVVVFVTIGWLLIATPLWRWAKGTLPVTQTNHDVPHPHH